jgi:hypothetical protein
MPTEHATWATPEECTVVGSINIVSIWVTGNIVCPACRFFNSNNSSVVMITITPHRLREHGHEK